MNEIEKIERYISSTPMRRLDWMQLYKEGVDSD